MTASLAIIVAVLLGALLLAFTAWLRPTLALALWVASSVMLSAYVLTANSPHAVHLTQLLLVGLLIGIGISWHKSTGPSVNPGRPELPMLGWAGWAIVSVYLGGAVSAAYEYRNINIITTGFVIPVLLLYLARSTNRSLSTVRSACVVLNVLLVYLIVTAFCEHFGIKWLVFPQYILDPTVGIHPDRARGPVVNAAENGGILAVLLLVALHRAHYALRPAERWLATLGVFLAGLPALWFTDTRGPWLAFAAGLLIMIFHDPRRAVLSALLGILIIALPLVALMRSEVVPDRAETTEFRLNLYRESLDAFKEHPIIGWGLGTFTNEDSFFDDPSAPTALSSGVQHDTTVAIATETGTVGVLLYAGFMIGLFRLLWRLRKFARSREKRDFYATCMAVLAAFLINGMFADCRYWMAQNVLVFFIVGLGLGLQPGEQVVLLPNQTHRIIRHFGYWPRHATRETIK